MARSEDQHLYSKEDVSYRKFNSESDEGKCGDCNFFESVKGRNKPGLCSVVRGRIDNDDTCNVFSPLKD